MTELRITMAHARAARQVGAGVLCAPGIRAWVKRHNIDVLDFQKNGMPLSRALEIDDAFARRVIEIAIEEAGCA